MEDESKKRSSTSSGKKSSRSKGRLSKRNSSSISRRRRRKTLAKLVSQNSVHNIHCFPFPFADLFCGCGKDCGKDKNKIRKISSKTLSKIRKKERPPSLKSENEVHKEILAVEDVPLYEEKEESNEDFAKITSEDAFAVLTEPLDFDTLRLSGNMKNLLASVKFTSIFGCANVPKTVSQIKILLDSNPALRTQLRHILGDNLKNETFKPVADLLASDIEENVIDSSNDSSIRHLSISKSVLEGNKEYDGESLDSSFLMSRKGEERTKRTDKDGSGTQGSYGCSRQMRRKSSSRRSDCESQMSLFAKIFSSVFRSTKPSKIKHKKTKSRERTKGTKENFLPQEIILDEEKMNDMREKYDEWYERSSEEVRERFRWEDYVRVTMYLNDINNTGSSNDDKTKEMLNLWLEKFSKEIHKATPPFEDNSSSILENEQISTESIALRTTLKRLVSEEMLNVGGGDVICRLNTLMKELVEATDVREEMAHGDAAGDIDDSPNFSPNQPGCSKWFAQDGGNPPDNNCKNNPNDEVPIYQTMCASFIDKLSKHGSKENKSIMGSRYASEIPWQNKDFQVFCVPTIQTQFSLCNLQNTDFEGNYYQTNGLNCQDENEDISNEMGEGSSYKYNSDASRGSLEPTFSYTNTSRSYPSNSTEEEEGKSAVQEDKKINVKIESKVLHQKRVSFDDNAINGPVSDDCPNTNAAEDTMSACILSSNTNRSEQDSNKEGMKETTSNNSSHHLTSEFSGDVNSFLSNMSDLSYILEHSDERYRSSRESINYIKEHKCELVGILKYLLSLANQDSNQLLFKSNQVEAVEVADKLNTCVGIQCKISEENTTKRISSDQNEIEEFLAREQQPLLKSLSETGPNKKGSDLESLDSDSAKLIPFLSDSGVHSNSSISSRRQFISLPDVLEGAPVVLGDKTTEEVPSQRSIENSVETKDTSSCNTLESCLSTSVSCQASQTPDIDDISQISTSDISDSQFKVHETMSSVNFKHSPEHAMTSSSEKSRSSENTRSCPEIQETKSGRSRFKNIFRKSIKESRK